jgi:hypothetical protein
VKIVSVIMTKPVHFNGKTSQEFVPGERGVESLDASESGIAVLYGDGTQIRSYPMHMVECINYETVRAATSKETPKAKK